MKKSLVFVMVACFTACGAWAADRFTTTITVAAGATSGTATLELFRADGPPCSTIERIVTVVDSGSGTGVVTAATYDYGVATATIATSTAIYDGQGYVYEPYVTRSSLYTYPVVQNVVTGDVVLAVSNLQTNYAVAVSSPIARQLYFTATQIAVADATVYKVSVYVKEDPPPVLK